VKETQADVENQQYLLATGQLEDAHTLPIAEMKAQISLDMMLSLRNKALESYNELIKMNV
jgi:flagellar hook-basal body complex protein FliE